MERIFLTVLLLFCTVEVQCSQEEEIKHITMACMEKEQVGVMDILGLAFKGPAISDEDNMKIKCVITCIVEESGLMDGCSVVYEQNKTQFANEEEKEAVYSMMNNCTTRFESDDRCECGYQMITCMSEFLGSNDDDD